MFRGLVGGISSFLAVLCSKKNLAAAVGDAGQLVASDQCLKAGISGEDPWRRACNVHRRETGVHTRGSSCEIVRIHKYPVCKKGEDTSVFVFRLFCRQLKTLCVPTANCSFQTMTLDLTPTQTLGNIPTRPFGKLRKGETTLRKVTALSLPVGGATE